MTLCHLISEFSSLVVLSAIHKMFFYESLDKEIRDVFMISKYPRCISQDIQEEVSSVNFTDFHAKHIFTVLEIFDNQDILGYNTCKFI